MQQAFYLQLIFILGAATALACWCGWGLARLTLPAALRPFGGLLTPLLGYCLAIVAGYWFVWTVSGLPLALVFLLPAAGALNIVAWRRTGPPRLLQGVREHWPLLLLLLATLLVGILPLLHYGHPAVIGAGWDIETALPTAHYLMRGPIAAIGDAPANPLRELVRYPPRIGKTVGFAVWQGSLGALTGVEPILTFAPLLAWLRALGVLAVYVLFRATLGLRRGPALLGAAWTSAGALMLWISYFNFEKQMASWALIPLGLLLAVAAVEDVAARGWRAWPALLVAALGLVAQAVAYYPALTLWVPLALGLAAAILIRSTNRLRLLAAALALALATLLLGAPAILDYWDGFAHRYSEQLTSLGVSHYIPPTDILGITPYIFSERNAPTTPVWALAGLGVFVALACAGIILPTTDDRPPATDHRRHSAFSVQRSAFSVPADTRLLWLGMAAGGLVYLAWLRYWQQYPYAYMKGAAYAGFAFLGVGAAGWQALSARLAPRLRLAAVVVPLGLLLAMIAGQARIVRMHWAEPGLYPNDFPALLDLRQRVPAGSTVTLADNLNTEGVTSGLAAYMLDHATVWGHVKTGYTSATTGEPDSIGEYALLPLSEDPVSYGYQDLIWSGGSYALYRRPPDALAQLRAETLLAPGASLAFTVGGNRLAGGQAALPGGPARGIVLTVAAIKDTAIDLGGRSIAIPAGAARVYLGLETTGRTLDLRNAGAAPLLLRSITLTSAAQASADRVEPLSAALVTSARAAADGQTVTTAVDVLLPNGGPVTLALDIWDNRRGLHYGWYGFTLRTSPRVQTTSLALDLAKGTAQARAGDGAPIEIGANFVGLREGSYTARLQFSAGGVGLTPPNRMFSFRVGRDGALSKIEGETVALLMATTDRPPQPLDVRVGDDVLLYGYAVDTTQPQPGATLNLTLWWASQAASLDERSVLVHLLDKTGAIVTQADGPPVQGARPTSQWQAGDVVIDSRQIALPANLPPGDYTLALGMYRWPSLDRLSLSKGGTRLDDDVLRVPISVRP